MPVLDPNRCARMTWVVGEGGTHTDHAVVEVGPIGAAWRPFAATNAADVADLAPRGYPGQGYWPFVFVMPMLDDAESQEHAGPEQTIDVEARVVTRTWTKVAKPLTDGVRAAARGMVDDSAEAFRLQFITPGAGQALTYQEKRAEAQRYVDSGGEGSYPILSASVGIEGETLAAIAGVVLSTAAAWTAIAAHIEGKRLSAKKAIDDAESWAELKAARAVDWMEGLPS